MVCRVKKAVQELCELLDVHEVERLFDSVVEEVPDRRQGAFVSHDEHG